MHKHDDYLIGQDWKAYRCTGILDSCDRIWFLRKPTIYRCQCNDKPWIQLCLKQYVHEIVHIGWELDLRGEANYGLWVDLKAYSLSNEDLQKELPIAIGMLMRAWEGVNQ